MEGSLLHQVLAVLVCNIVNMSSGAGVGYTGSYADTIIQQLDINKDLLQLLVGCVSIGGLAGCFISGKLADKCGRKKALMVSFSLNSLGWLLVSVSGNGGMIFSGRIIHGIGEGLGVSVSVIYLEELIDEKYRGGAIATVTASCQLGIALAYIFGVAFTWQVSAGVLMTVNLGSLACMTLLPESKPWLEHKLKKEESDSMETKNSNDRFSFDKEQGSLISKSSYTKQKSAYIISTIIPPLFLFLYPLSGGYTISFYAISIVENMNVGHAKIVAIIVGLVRTCGTVSGILFVQKFGRRTSLLVSASSTTVFLLSVSVLLPFSVFSVFNDTMIFLLAAVMFSNSLGMIVTPWVLCGEWPSIQNKATVSGVGTLLYYASVFLSSQIPPLLEPSLGLPGMFLVFAAVTLFFLGTVFFAVPETSGKTYQQYITENHTQ